MLLAVASIIIFALVSYNIDRPDTFVGDNMVSALIEHVGTVSTASQ